MPLKPLFNPGRILMTPGAVEAMQRAKVKPSTPIIRHLSGDWGDLDTSDKLANERAIKPGMDPLRVFSAYKLTPDYTIWVITEWDRSVTTILLPEEY